MEKLDIDPFHFKEILVVQICTCKKVKVTLALVYRSPNSSNENDNNLNEILTHLTNLKLSNVLIIGDNNFKIKLKFISLKVILKHLNINFLNV